MKIALMSLVVIFHLKLLMDYIKTRKTRIAKFEYDTELNSIKVSLIQITLSVMLIVVLISVNGFSKTYLEKFASLFLLLANLSIGMSNVIPILNKNWVYEEIIVINKYQIPIHMISEFEWHECDENEKVILKLKVLESIRSDKNTITKILIAMNLIEKIPDMYDLFVEKASKETIDKHIKERMLMHT